MPHKKTQKQRREQLRQQLKQVLEREARERQASNDELLDLVYALQTALHRCYVWRNAPDYVEGIALTALSDSDDVLSGYELADD